MVLLLLNPIKIKFTFTEIGEYEIGGDKKIPLEILSSFLYDFNLLYDCLALASIKDYSDYNFSQFFFYRRGRRLKTEHKLYLNKISHNSPLELEVVVPLAATIAGIPWLILQSVQKLQNWNLEKTKLKLDVEMKEIELAEKRTTLLKDNLEIQEKLLTLENLRIYNSILKRLEKYPFIATDMDMDIFTPNRDENQNENTNS